MGRSSRKRAGSVGPDERMAATMAMLNEAVRQRTAAAPSSEEDTTNANPESVAGEDTAARAD